MKWEELVNAESETGEWDFFNTGVLNPENNPTPIRLCRFDGAELIVELLMTKEQWVDLVNLVKRIG